MLYTGNIIYVAGIFLFGAAAYLLYWPPVSLANLASLAGLQSTVIGIGIIFLTGYSAVFARNIYFNTIMAFISAWVIKDYFIYVGFGPLSPTQNKNAGAMGALFLLCGSVMTILYFCWRMVRALNRTTPSKAISGDNAHQVAIERRRATAPTEKP